VICCAPEAAVASAGICRSADPLMRVVRRASPLKSVMWAHLPSNTCALAGVCLYIMLAGCLPFDERSVGALTKKIATAEYEMPPWISQHAAALLRAILQPNPAKR
jgi:serine/threonine protein kinase